MPYDIVIRGGTVVDGSGLGSYRADVGVMGDRIASIGRISERGRDEIDAEGQVVTPGFIDGHTHMDAQVFWDASGSSSCWHGVTSAVMGNCGFTLAPVRSDERALVVRNLERAEDIDPVALAEGIDWTLRDVSRVPRRGGGARQGDQLCRQCGPFRTQDVGHGGASFRGAGLAGGFEADDAQLGDALRAGAVGFSTSRIEHHVTSDDRPVASRLASWDEVASLVGVMGEMGCGIFEGVDSGMSAQDPEVRARTLGRMKTLAAETGVPLTFGLVATSGAGHLLDFLDDVADAGGRAFAQTHCRGISVLLSLKTRLPFDLLKEWQDLRARPLHEQLGLLARPRSAPALCRRRRSRRLWPMEGARSPGAAARFRGHPRLPAGVAAESFRGRGGPAAGPAPGRGDDRTLRCLERESALHSAEPLSSGRSHVVAGTPPSSGRNDLLGLRSPPQPDRRFLYPHAPLGLLGP